MRRPNLPVKSTAAARSAPLAYQQSFALLALMRRVAAEADGTDQEAGYYTISSDLLDSINELLFAIDARGP